MTITDLIDNPGIAAVHLRHPRATPGEAQLWCAYRRARIRYNWIESGASTNGKAGSELNLVGWYRYQFQSAPNSLDFSLYVPNTKNTLRGE